MDDLERRRFAVTVAGRRLAVEELAPAAGTDGPALVFLHEGLGSIALWKDIPARLARRLDLRAIAYDRWGHGASEPLEGARGRRYLHDEALLFLPGLLDALELRDVVLIGHSDGGTIALLYAAAFPERVRALVTIAAHVFVEDLSLAGIRAAVEAYRTGDLAARLARYHGERTDSLFHAWADTWLAPWFRDWNIEDCLPEITAPALVVQGTDDRYGTPAQVEAIARGLAGPCRTLMLPGLGHAPHLEARALIVDALADFLASALDRQHGLA